MATFSRVAGHAVTLLALVLALVAACASAAPAEQTLLGRDLQLHFMQLYCPNYNEYIWFYTVQPAPTGMFGSGFSFDFQADSTALGGYKIMAPFKAVDGTTYTTAQGFDPCQYTTCAGVSCANASETLAQNYVNNMALLFPGSTEYSYYDYGVNPSSVTPRCGCFDFVGGSVFPTAGLDIYNVNPAGPSAEKSNPLCSGLQCDPNPDFNIAYYLQTPDGTAANCQCCNKQTNLLATSSSFPATCGVVTPTPASTVNPVAPSGSAMTPPTPTDPVTPPASIIDFINDACVPGTLDSVNTTMIDEHADEFCCYFTSKYNSSNVLYLCGDSARTLRQDGNLLCISSIPEAKFTCCASITFNGVITSTGRACGSAIRPDDGDFAHGKASTFFALLVAVAVALSSVILGF